MNLSQIVFHFLDEFFIQESLGNRYYASEFSQKERWKTCDSCEHFDEPEEGCKYCGCYLPHKIKDPFGSCPLDKWISNSDQWNAEHFDQIKNKLIEKYPELENELNGNS